jgi:glucokinase
MRDRDASGVWVGFDLGGTKMLATVYDDQFQPLGRERKKTKGNEGSEAGMQRIVQTIVTALQTAGRDRASLRGIGMACPGPLDLDQGVLLDAPNLGWKNVPLAKLLQRELGCPIVICNDVDAGVFGEYRFGAAQKARCVLGVFPGTGIGGGCVYEGKILRGQTGSCMEIGHVQVVPQGPRCGCGRNGCLEAVASRLAISAAAAAAAYRGEAPHLLKAAGTDVANIRSSTLAAAIAAGDKVIEQIVRTAAQHIGIAVANAIHLLAPDVVVLGGGLAEALPDLLVSTVSKVARDRVMPAFEDSFRVVPAQLGDDATTLGSAAWAKELIEAA